MATWLLRTAVAMTALSTMVPVNPAMAQQAEQQPAAPTTSGAPATGATTSAAPGEVAQSAPQSAAPTTSAAPGEVAQSAPQSAAASPVISPPASAASDATKNEDELPVLFPAASRVRLSGYGAIDGGYTRVAGKDAALACAGGAFLLNRTLALGIMGCGVPTRISGQAYGNVAHEAGDRLELGYGGVFAGYHFFPNKLYNLALSAMVGGGAAQIADRHWINDDEDYDEHVKTTDPVFIAEARLTGLINVTRWARAGVFAGYRVAGGVEMRNLSESDLSGPVAGGTLQFGWF